MREETGDGQTLLDEVAVKGMGTETVIHGSVGGHQGLADYLASIDTVVGTAATKLVGGSKNWNKINTRGYLNRSESSSSNLRNVSRRSVLAS